MIKTLILLCLILNLTLAQINMTLSPCIHLTLELPLNIYFGQENIPLSLRVKNACDTSLQIYLSGQPPYDFLVKNAESTLWQWSYGKVIPMALQVFVLEPGQEVAFEEFWTLTDNQGETLTAGHYTLQGFLKGEYPNIYQTEIIQLEILP
jgi:hypothetical protein